MNAGEIKSTITYHPNIWTRNKALNDYCTFYLTKDIKPYGIKVYKGEQI